MVLGSGPPVGGHGLELPSNRGVELELKPPAQHTKEMDYSEHVAEGQDDHGGAYATAEKSIYMVSDGTGWTAEHSLNAALGQFEYCLVDRGCPVNPHLFSGGSSQRRDRLQKEICRLLFKESEKLQSAPAHSSENTLMPANLTVVLLALSHETHKEQKEKRAWSRKKEAEEQK